MSQEILFKDERAKKYYLKMKATKFKAQSLKFTVKWAVDFSKLFTKNV